jgi:hypothetical protein
LIKPCFFLDDKQPELKMYLDLVVNGPMDDIERNCEARKRLAEILLKAIQRDLNMLKMSIQLDADDETDSFDHVADLATIGRQILQGTNKETEVERFMRPGILQRVWFPLTVASVSFIVLYSKVDFHAAYHSAKAFAWQAWDTAVGLVREWIYKPTQDMLKTIRHQEARLAIMSSGSLSADLDSLERMVVAYVQDHGEDSTSAIEAIAKQVKNGDLTAVLQHYEEDIKHPINAALRGDLIRSLLIQIQKAKVDGELAMTALDKLLRSNELNFAFLAVMPTFSLSYLAVTYLGRITGELVSTKATIALAQSVLLDIERLAGMTSLHAQDTALYRGMIICELSHLRSIISNLQRNARTPWTVGIKDMENIIVYEEHDLSTKISRVLTRLWRRM